MPLDPPGTGGSEGLKTGAKTVELKVDKCEAESMDVGGRPSSSARLLEIHYFVGARRVLAPIFVVC